jgi:hypothetical protein
LESYLYNYDYDDVLYVCVPTTEQYLVCTFVITHNNNTREWNLKFISNTYHHGLLIHTINDNIDTKMMILEMLSCIKYQIQNKLDI